MKTLAIAGLTLLLITNAVFAANAPNESLASKVVQLSGIERSLASLPETLNAQSEILALTQLTEEKSPAEEDALSAYDPEAAKNQLIQYIADNCDADSLSKTITWLESPLGREITAAEDAEKGLALQSGMLKFLAEMKENPPGQERIILVRKLALVSGQLEMVSKIFESTAVRMASAMAGGNPEVEAFARTKVKDTWIPLEKQFLQQLVVSNLYVYRNFPDYDIASYIAFLESEAGKRYTKTVVEGYGLIIEDLVMETQKEMIEEIKKQAQSQSEDGENP